MLTSIMVVRCDRKCGEEDSFPADTQPYQKLLRMGWTVPVEGGDQLTICPDCSKKEARPPVDPARGPDRYSPPSGYQR